MRGRTMYVVPFSMGPLGSPISYIGVQLTDSAYVAASMRIMTRMGQPALDCLGDDGDFVPCLHSVGMPLTDGRRGRPVAVQRRQQVHRPLPRDARDLVVRLGLRRQRAARQEVLRAADRVGDGARRGLARRAHADPQADLAGGRGQVHGGGVPERLRQDQPCDADPDAARLEGRDDRRRHRVDEVRRGRPVCTRSTPRPASSASRRAPARSRTPTRSTRSRATSIFTNCAKTDDGDIWWEGMTGEPPAHAIDWRGNDWTPESETPAAHPNARFTRPASPSARRSPPSGRTPPACRSTRCCSAAAARPSCRWSTRRATGSTACSWARRCPRRRPRPRRARSGELRWDPMAMLPFCGYNMADYFAHWLKIGRREGAKLPEDLLRQLVPQGRGREVPVARLRRELPRPGVDLPPLRGKRRGGRDRRSACSRRSARAGSTPTGLDVSRRGDGEAAGGRSRRLEAAAPADARALRRVRRQAAGRAARAARRARRRLTSARASAA